MTKVAPIPFEAVGPGVTCQFRPVDLTRLWAELSPKRAAFVVRQALRPRFVETLLADEILGDDPPDFQAIARRLGTFDPAAVLAAVKHGAKRPSGEPWGGDVNKLSAPLAELVAVLLPAIEAAVFGQTALAAKHDEGASP